MANLTETPNYEAGIFQLEKITPALGGPPLIDSGVPSAGFANVPAQQLANRTAWLKQKVDSIELDSEGYAQEAKDARDSSQAYAIESMGYLTDVQAEAITVHQDRLATEEAANSVGNFVAELSNNLDPTKGSKLIGSKFAASQSIGRDVSSKIYETVSAKDFGAMGDGITDDFPAIQKAFDWAQEAVRGKGYGVRIHFPAGEYRMSQLAICNIAPPGTVTGTGMVSIHITGDGDTATVFVATNTNTTGCIRLTSGRNTECFRVADVSFLSDLDEDASTNSGIALQIDSSLALGQPGYGDHPRWTVLVEQVFIGGYGKTAGDLARRGNWKKGIYVANKWYIQFKNVRCLGRYSASLLTRTACDYAIHLYSCYSPDFSDIYIHGNWDYGVCLDGVLDSATGDYEDFRFNNTFFVGQNRGLTVQHSYTDTASFRLYEPGGYIGGVHVNCYQFGITIKNHRQVLIDGVYGYSPTLGRAQGELLPSIILLDGASDIRIKAETLEPGFYISNTNASVGVRIENNSEAITLDLQLGHGGIGVLNNSTSTNKTIFLDNKMPTSRRNNAWNAPLIAVVDNVNGLTAISNSFAPTQDRVTLSNNKPSSATYPIAYRLQSNDPTQLICGAYEIAGVNSAGTVLNIGIQSTRFTTKTAGAEDSITGTFVLGGGSIREGWRVSPTTVDGQTYGTLLTREAGVLSLKRVLVGPADSAGAGFKSLRVVN